MKKIITLAVITALAGGAYAYVDSKYNEVIVTELTKFEEKLKTQNIDLSYGDIDATFIKKEINLNDLTFTIDKGTEKEIVVAISELKTNRDTFTSDSYGLFPVSYISISNAYIEGKGEFALNGKTYFDLNQEYQYNEKTNEIDTNFIIDVKGLMKVEAEVNVNEAGAFWTYLSTVDKETNLPSYKIDSEESFKKAFGDFSIENVSLSVTDNGFLNSIAEYGVSIGQGKNVESLREIASLQISPIEKNIPSTNSSLSSFVKDGGKITIALKPEEPKMLINIVKELDVAQPEMVNIAKLLKSLNFNMTHSK